MSYYWPITKFQLSYYWHKGKITTGFFSPSDCGLSVEDKVDYIDFLEVSDVEGSKGGRAGCGWPFVDDTAEDDVVLSS